MSNALTLYTISQDLGNILGQLEENGGELTPEIEKALTITQEQFNDKAVDYGHAILNFEAMAAAAKAEKERLASLQKYYENTAKALSKRITDAMETFQIDKAEKPTLRISIKRTMAVADDYDINSIPKILKSVKVEEKPDKTNIKGQILAKMKKLKEEGKVVPDPTVMGAYIPGVRVTENVSLHIK